MLNNFNFDVDTSQTVNKHALHIYAHSIHFDFAKCSHPIPSHSKSFSNASFAHQFLDENWFVYLSRTFRGIDILSILWKCIHYYDCKAHQWVYRTALNMLTVKLLSSCSWYLIHDFKYIDFRTKCITYLFMEYIIPERISNSSLSCL